MASQPALKSQDGSSNRSPPERCPHPMKSIEEHHNLQDYQFDGMNDIKVEVQEEAEEMSMMGDNPCKEEDVPPEISTDGCSKRNPPERSPHRLYSCDSMQEHHEISQDNQGESFIDVKSEEQEDAEREVKVCKLCKDEEMPLEIDTGEHCNNREKCPVMPPGHEVEDPNITIGSSEENPDTQNLQLVKNKQGMQAYCSECDKSFTRKTQLVLHQRIHTGEKPYLCEECGRCFTQKGHRDQHRRTHSGEKPFCCSNCGKRFAQRSSLVRHQGLHTEDKPYFCSECGKSFKAKSTLLGHLRTHTGEKPFSCPECGKSFTSSSNLAIHEKIHLDEKPFSCPECGKRCIQKAHLEMHQRIHTGEKPYSCSECGKSFACKSNLVVHEKTHKDEKPYSCSRKGPPLLDTKEHTMVKA